MVCEPAPTPIGTGPGDRNDWSPASRGELGAAGGELRVPFKQASRDPDPKRSAWLPGPRRPIETAIGRPVDRFGCRRVKVKDLWHLAHRLLRKILSQTVAIRLNVQARHEPLRFDALAA